MDDFLNDIFNNDENDKAKNESANQNSDQNNGEIPINRDSYGTNEESKAETEPESFDTASSQNEEETGAQTHNFNEPSQNSAYTSQPAQNSEPAAEKAPQSTPQNSGYSPAGSQQPTQQNVYGNDPSQVYRSNNNNYYNPNYNPNYNQNYQQQQNPAYPQSDRKVFYQPPIPQNANDKKAKTNTAPVTSQKAPKKKHSNTARIIIAIIAVIAIAAAGFGIGYAARNTSGSSSSSSSSSDSDSGSSSSSSGSSDAEAKVKSSDKAAKKSSNGDYTVAGVVEKVKSSCVGITVYTQQNDFGDFYSFGSSGSDSSNGDTEAGEGSGVIMSEADGKTYIMTCAHVVSDGSKFKVTLDNDKEYDATLVGSDSQTDIAVLSINATGLNIAEFGDSKDIEVGSDCVAIGCPGGLEFKNSVTKGIVSALDVPVSSSIGYDNECIQVDAAINPGNSGGALFNMQGQVIGINSSKIASTEYEGMGFAVPSDTAVSTANSLIKNGYVKGRAKLGISYAPLSALTSGSDQILAALEQQGFKDAEGAMIIREVSSDSDLNGKVQQNDMIVAINGKTLTSTDVLTSVLSKSKPGDTVKLTIARVEGNNIRTFNVNCKLIESKE